MQHWSEQGLRYLKGVGPKVAEKLARLGLTTQRDLLFHLPLRYEDRTEISPLGSLRAVRRCLIEAEVLAAAKLLVKSNPEVGALVLECTDMPPYAHKLQEKLRLPIFDLTTLATMVHEAVFRLPYQGVMPLAVGR